MTKLWQAHYETWRKMPGTDELEDIRRRLQPAREDLKKCGPEDWQFLQDLLDEEGARHFVADLFAGHAVPERLFDPMIRAAINELDPSNNQDFVFPLKDSFGTRRVVEALHDTLQTGSNGEKAGAVRALYWGFANSAGEPVDDLRQRTDQLFLQEFVNNKNKAIRRSIIASLKLDPSHYPEGMQHLVETAINIARTHRDSYIRHRLKVQLGVETVLQPLPASGLRAGLFTRFARWLWRDK